MFGRSSSLNRCPTTRCTTRAMRRSAAGRAPGRWPRARMSVEVAGPARRRRNAGCTRWTAVNFDVAATSWLGTRGPMKISAKAEYACLAVLALARHGPGATPLRIREISGSYGIPERYLVQILLQLKGAGLVTSTRGASGGYRLARAPDKISLAEVVNLIDRAPAPRPAPVASPRSPLVQAVRGVSKPGQKEVQR